MNSRYVVADSETIRENPEIVTSYQGSPVAQARRRGVRLVVAIDEEAR